jgi:phytoene/squalene synthetase
MFNIDLYQKISSRLSKDITESYSTSFSLATGLLSPEVAESIYAIYGFVRIADEIVDSWRPKDMGIYLDELSSDYKRAVKSGFSVNPIVQSFAGVLRKYEVSTELVEAFLKSMRMDIKKKTYSLDEYQEYIYGSAEVVGLMCLMVFVNGNKRTYKSLEPGAKALGAAFQKVNFLRDLSDDSNQLGRLYFPDKNPKHFSEQDKIEIVDDIKKDLALAKKAINELPVSSRFGVELAYKYFRELNKKLSKTPIQDLQNKRISVSAKQKTRIYIVVKSKQLLARQ